MRLGIVSDCIHYKTPDGRIGTENHILLKQLQTLCSFFPETLICCPFAEYDTSKVISVYTDNSIQFTPVPLAGGDSLAAKFRLMSVIPSWYRGFRKINTFSDIVYQRFPNNLNIPGFFFFWLRKKKVFGTYTGTWSDYKTEPSTYRFQKWLLKTVFRGPVWVYSVGKTGSKRILNGFSPSYSEKEWEEETQQVKKRIDNLKCNKIRIFRLITVGTLINYKNQTGIIGACVILKQNNFPFKLTIVGDGPMRKELEAMIEENKLHHDITLVGKKNDLELRELYRNNDFVVQAPLSEGFGKVPVEGFFHGLVPVISNTVMAKFMTGDEERGFVFDASNEHSLANTLLRIREQQYLLPQIIERGRAFAKSQTLEAWASEYYNKIEEYFA
jgi:glycosyltransferase involved in cell wall biosynthesis